MKFLRMKNLLIVSIVLSCIVLFLPFIHLEIGPSGYKLYGENVPDIYILGATILGKDRAFWGINFAYKFQLTVIIIYVLLGIIAVFRNQKNKSPLKSLFCVFT